MHTMQKPSITSGGSFGPLSPYIGPYLAEIRNQGYSPQSLCEQTHVLEACGRWLERTGRSAGDLNESIAHECLQRVVRRGFGRNTAPATLRRLLAMLRRIGVTPEPEAPRLNPSEQMAHNYADFLLEERNLAPRTIAIRRLVASRFLSEKFGSAPTQTIQPACAGRDDFCATARA